MKTKSTLEYALIGLLNQRAQSGYDLRKTFTTTAMSNYSDSPGSIYPALRRLEARGWIEAEAPPSGQETDPRKRQVFRLTNSGKAALVAWIEQPIQLQDMASQLAELMLRFAFMDGNVPRTTTLRFLEDFEQALGSHIAKLRVQFNDLSAKYPLHTGTLAFQSGIESMEAQTAWARQARARLLENSI
jgi:DNA-binding PadR family transcriptional regulator